MVEGGTTGPWCDHWRTFRYLVSCASYSNTSSSLLWGPDVHCRFGDGHVRSDPLSSELRPAVEGPTPAPARLYRAVTECYQTFKCGLHSLGATPPEVRWNDALYECAPEPSALFDGWQAAASACNATATHNVTLVARHVLQPVSELLVKLPKLLLLHAGGGEVDQQPASGPLRLSWNGSEQSQYRLVCGNTSSTDGSFFENDAFELVNASLLEPIQCWMDVQLQTTIVSQWQNGVEQAVAALAGWNQTLFVDELQEMGAAVATAVDGDAAGRYDWSFLFVFLFIFAGGLGNILVCLAVALDRKLQNVTNYFLLSLAIADLLVSLFVMPLGAIPGFLE